MSYTKEQKKIIYNNLPNDLKEAIISVETFEKIQKISGTYSLMLDEVSELVDEINLLLLGLTRQEDFTRNISKRLNIPYDKAYKIAEDINAEIFDPIRSSLQKIQEQNMETEAQAETQPKNTASFGPSSIEQAGQFTVENDVTPVSSPQYTETNIDREKLLKKIEDTPNLLTDHLLTTPVTNTQQTEEKKVYTSDPYREPIK